MLQCYVDRDFGEAALGVIEECNAIVEEYAEAGYDLTLRQLYYQMVARGRIPNEQKEYKRLGSIVNDGRMAGLIRWDRIVDRTRNLRSNPHWASVGDIVKTCAEQYRIDTWDGQESRVEVWIEKDALVGVIEGVCRQNDVAWFSCRGYVSQSEMWAAAQRIGHREADTLILHLGDHDPSGIDMTRDIRERLATFRVGDRVTVQRIALTMEQVVQLQPPPNPAKVTDSRASGYIQKYGGESWELDALPPDALVDLVQTHIDAVVDHDQRRERMEQQAAGRKRLWQIADQEG